MDLVDRISDGFNIVAADTKINRRNFFENHFWQASPNSHGSIDYIGTPTNVGSGSAVITTQNHSVRKIKRFRISTTALAGNVLSRYNNNDVTTGRVSFTDALGSQGFEFNTVVIPSCAALVAGHRFWVGFANAQPTTNLEYATLSNAFGICKQAASDNLFISYGGTVAQTPIDLGVNFPAVGLQDDAYEINFKSVEYGKMQYKITRLNTGHVAQGEIVESTPGAGVQLPSVSLKLKQCFIVTNNANAAIASIDIGKTTIIGYGY